MPDRPYVLEATRENFPQLVLENSRKGPVLVDFWAAYAGPSLRQREVLLRLADEYGGRFLLITVDTQRQKEIARQFGVKSLPSCKVFRHGQPVEHVHGMQTEADYRELIERHIVPLADKVQAAALTASKHGDHDKAIQILAEGAMAEPENPALPLLLAKLLVSLGRHDDAYSVLSSLPQALGDNLEIRALLTHLELIRAGRDTRSREALEAVLVRNPDDAATRFMLAALELVGDDYVAALEQLAELNRRKPDFRHGLPRRALMAVLDTLDADDEHARPFRRALFEH